MKSIRSAILLRIILVFVLVESILLVVSVALHFDHLEADFATRKAFAELAQQAPPSYHETVLAPLGWYALRFLGTELVVLLFLLLLVHIGLKRVLYAPMEDILRANQALADTGELNRSLIPENRIPNNEFGVMMRSRTRTLEALFTSREELAAINSRLEAKVRDRTRELNDALEQLQSSQTRLLHAEKMSTLGTVSASLAHDLAHPLTAIRFYAHALSQDTSPASPSPTRLAEVRSILDAIDQAQSIIEHFREFARKPQPLHRVDLNQCVQRSCTLMAHQLYHDGVHLHVNPASDLPLIWGDEVLLQQVILNLIANARDALLEDRFIRTPAIHVRTERGPHHVVLTVSDNGPGIPEANQGRIFDSFFTTKEVGKGTGLGLPIVKSIVDQLGGWIELGQADGSGALFRVVLPIASCDENVNAVRNAPSHQEPAPTEAAPLQPSHR